MKKQFLLLAVVILAGISFSFLKDNGLKACCKKAPACSGAARPIQQKMQIEYVESHKRDIKIQRKICCRCPGDPCFIYWQRDDR